MLTREQRARRWRLLPLAVIGGSMPALATLVPIQFVLVMWLAGGLIYGTWMVLIFREMRRDER